MHEDTINVFCLSHGVSFPTLGSNRLVICKENHVLSHNFPHSGRWFYCCLCQKYWVAPKGEGGDVYSKQCPSCNLIKKARYYSCDQCNVTMIDSIGSINRKGVHITPWGTPHPHCPGCHQLPKAIPQSHACPDLNGLLTTARAQCPFCEGQDSAGTGGEIVKSGNEPEASQVGKMDEVAQVDSSYLGLEELERKAAEIRALEAEAEAREAKAQERLRQVEARLRQEMSRRSELERKSLEIEEELKRQPEDDESNVEAVGDTSEDTAQFEEEKAARIAAEQEKAEAEAKLLELEARASEAEERLRKAEIGIQQESSKRVSTEERLRQVESGLQQESSKRISAEDRLRQTESGLQQETSKRISAEDRLRQTESGLQQETSKRISIEERLRQTESGLQQECSNRASAEERLRQAEAGLQQESSKRASAEARANELEVKLAAETAKIKAESEAKIQGIAAETRRIEENYKVEIDWIREELEGSVAAARQAEEKHKAEINRIMMDADSRVYQAEASTRQQYQIKVEEALDSAQNAMFNLEETQKKLYEAEARCRQMELRAIQAETRSQRLYLISKLTFTTAEQVIADALNADDEDEKGAKVVSLDVAKNAYNDDFPTDMPEMGSNGSMDYGEYPFTERMRALFQAAARANSADDKGADVAGDEFRMASGE
jgi:hypothetical protein